MTEGLEGKYVLGPVLGSGGMGIVYSATQIALGRRVAIKVPHPHLAADPVTIRRFRAEAIAGARLDHRNTARVIDFGGREGALYLVMEYVSGIGLDRFVAERGPVEPRMAIELCGQLLAGLEDAHTSGIIHADIKSGNVLVETRGDGSMVVRIIDFGLARFPNEPGFGSDLLLSGTPEYLAPEIIQGGLPTIASDIYAAGIVLYELLTGSTPFGGGGSAQIMQRHVDDWVVPPSLRNTEQDFATGLEDAVMRALAKDPGARFASARAFAAALRDSCPAPDAGPTRRLAQGTSVSVFSIEATTRDLVRALPLVSQVQQGHLGVSAAIADGNSDTIVTSYLELVRALIDQRQLSAAVGELEHGLDLLRPIAAAGAQAPRAMWPLQLCLAALYSGLGDSIRARCAATVGQDDALQASSIVGQDRAHDLLTRLSRSH